MIDMTVQPEIEWDEDCISLSWFSPDKNELASIRIADDSIIGTYVGSVRTSWKLPLLAGLIRVDTSMLEIAAPKE